MSVSQSDGQLSQNASAPLRHVAIDLVELVVVEDRRLRHTILPHNTPVHTGAVQRHRDCQAISISSQLDSTYSIMALTVPSVVQRDHAADASVTAQLLHANFCCTFDRLVQVLHPSADSRPRRETDEILGAAISK